MKKVITLTCIALLAFSFVNCKNKKQTTKKQENITTSKVVDAIMHDTYSYPKDAAGFEVISASISGDILKIAVTYSGGCANHSFSLNATPMYMKSMPPKLQMFLEHNANNDNCRELITETLLFNIKAMRYPGTEKNYTVHLGFNNFDDYLVYKY